MYAYTIKLYDHLGRAISHDGKVIVMEAGSPDKPLLYNAAGASLANPVTITDGSATFYTAETYKKVDLSILTEYGYATFVRDVFPGQPLEVTINLSDLFQTLIIPFSVAHAGYAAATEQDTGLDAIVGTQLLPIGQGIKVTVADATETLDFGLDGAGAEDDPNGLIEAISVAATGIVQSQLGFRVGTNNTVVDLTGGDVEWTFGALMHPAATKVAKSEGGDAAGTDGNGFGYTKAHLVAAASADFTWTLTAGSDTAKGYIIQPMLLSFPAALS